ncbi:MAG: hypothetical protein AAFN81_21150 [Bacteroidota bacterium]
MINVGWATYWEVEFYSFHGSFMQQMSEQLLLEANQLSGIQDLTQHGFRIFYGMNGVQSQQQQQHGTTTVQLLLPNSTVLPLSVSWDSKVKIPEPFYQQDLSKTSVRFRWDDSFPATLVAELCKSK